MKLDQLLQSAKRCQAAYASNYQEAAFKFKNLGCTFIDYYNYGGVQAVLSLNNGSMYLSIAGTRNNINFVEDLETDLEITSIHVGGKATVSKGAYSGLQELWDWVLSYPFLMPLNIEGHSLGAWRAYYSPLFYAPKKILALTCFESPKAANQNYWKTHLIKSTISVVHQDDMFFHYPWINPGQFIQPPIEHIWLHDGQIDRVEEEEIEKGWSLEDHKIDNVIETLERLE